MLVLKDTAIGEVRGREEVIEYLSKNQVPGGRAAARLLIEGKVEEANTILENANG